MISVVGLFDGLEIPFAGDQWESLRLRIPTRQCPGIPIANVDDRRETTDQGPRVGRIVDHRWKPIEMGVPFSVDGIENVHGGRYDFR
jgi:hypothetical protein